MKKVGKTTRPFRYDLNQIPYIYTVEVTNRFKELDMIEYPKNHINNLGYADDTTLMAESEGELKSLWMKVKEESEKVGLNSTFRKLRSWHPVLSLHAR